MHGRPEGSKRRRVATLLQWRHRNGQRGPAVTVITVSSREFNQDTSKAKKAARRGPVVITDRGRPAHVLLSIEQYQALTGAGENIIDLLALPGAERVRFNPPKLRKIARAADLG